MSRSTPLGSASRPLDHSKLRRTFLAGAIERLGPLPTLTGGRWRAATIRHREARIADRGDQRHCRLRQVLVAGMRHLAETHHAIRMDEVADRGVVLLLFAILFPCARRVPWHRHAYEARSLSACRIGWPTAKQ